MHVTYLSVVTLVLRPGVPFRGRLPTHTRHTAGPNRRQLKVKDPSRFNWHPKELLPQLASIYLHLERADSKGVFAAAVAVSGRYRQDMFPDTCQVTTLLNLPSYTGWSPKDPCSRGNVYQGTLGLVSVMSFCVLH